LFYLEQYIYTVYLFRTLLSSRLS